MKIILFFLSIVVFIHANIVPNNKDEQYGKMILGVWSFQEASHDIRYYGEYLYKNDGTKEGYIEVCERERCIVEHFNSTWEIEDGFLISIVQSSNTEFLPPKLKIVDKILKINKMEMLLHSTSGKEKNTRILKSRFFNANSSL